MDISNYNIPSMLSCCWLGDRKGIRPEELAATATCKCSPLGLGL